MGALILLLILVALDLVVIRWGVDSRTLDAPHDRNWWPNPRAQPSTIRHSKKRLDDAPAHDQTPRRRPH